VTQRATTHAQWLAEARSRFGADPMKWRFVCPSCGHVASIQDWGTAGAGEGEVAFSCIGRHVGDRAGTEKAAFSRSGGPCNYAGGGLFKLNPVAVDFEDGDEPRMTFEFAPVLGTSDMEQQGAAA
jgi:hypothetical protein